MSVYDPSAFSERVNYAVKCIASGKISGRAFDTCFEMHDGDAVSVAVYRRSLSNPVLAERIWNALSQNSVMEAVKELENVPTSSLYLEAQRAREEAKARFTRWMEEQRQASRQN